MGPLSQVLAAALNSCVMSGKQPHSDPWLSPQSSRTLQVSKVRPEHPEEAGEVHGLTHTHCSLLPTEARAGCKGLRRGGIQAPLSEKGAASLQAQSRGREGPECGVRGGWGRGVRWSGAHGEHRADAFRGPYPLV